MAYVVGLRGASRFVLNAPVLSLAQERDCCDGSDEHSGVCPNVCKEVGEAYRQQVKAERKIRKTVGYNPAPKALAC